MPMIFTGAKQEPVYTTPLYGLHARYTLSAGIELPYFLTAMDINRAIDELKIHDEVPPSLDRKWSLTELFQRELDEGRVSRELVKGYLNDPGKLKFFNAITIVLMAKTPNGELLPCFPAGDYDPSIPWNGTDETDAQWNEAYCKRVNFGGVQFVTVEHSDQARLRWNQDLVHAVAVDGQHRLLALRQFREDARGRALDATERQTQIPVIFLLLDRTAGFTHPDHSDLTIRSVSRELFTDLNKNAKQVDQARQLILDDLSVGARCVRTLVTNETSSDSKELLPLTLVRWQDAINRFDQSYYVNSLVHLDLLVDMVLDLSPPRDPMDKKQVEEFLRSLSTSLGTSEGGRGRELRAGERTLNQVFVEDYCDPEGEIQIPFMRLPTNFLDAAVRGFEKNHKPWLLRLLRDFKPYREISSYARQHNLIEGEFGGFWSQTERHRRLLQESKVTQDSDWYKRTIQSHIAAIEGMKGKDADAQWAFKAIFQKAVVSLGRTIAFEFGDSDPNLGTIDDFLHFLTEIQNRDLLKVGAMLPDSDFSVWNFIATNVGGGKIKVAKATMDRLLSVLTLWYYGNRKAVLDTSKQHSAKSLLIEFEQKKSRPAWPSCDEHFGRLYKTFDCQGLHGKDVTTITDKTRRKKVLEHFTKVMSVGILVSLSDGTDIPDGEGRTDVKISEEINSAE